MPVTLIWRGITNMYIFSVQLKFNFFKKKIWGGGILFNNIVATGHFVLCWFSYWKCSRFVMILCVTTFLLCWLVVRNALVLSWYCRIITCTWKYVICMQKIKN